MIEDGHDQRSDAGRAVLVEELIDLLRRRGLRAL